MQAAHKTACTKGRRLRPRRFVERKIIKKKNKTFFEVLFGVAQRRDHPSLSNMALPWTCDREFSFFRFYLCAPLFFFSFSFLNFSWSCWTAERKSRIDTHTHILFSLSDAEATDYTADALLVALFPALALFLYFIYFGFLVWEQNFPTAKTQRIVQGERLFQQS